MSHDELIEELAREHRYRGVLVISAVVGIIASAILGIAFTIGHQLEGWEPRGFSERATFGLFVLPFAVSMVIGGGIHKVLLSRGRRTKRAR
jgi:hypothetical protein